MPDYVRKRAFPPRLGLWEAFRYSWRMLPSPEISFRRTPVTLIIVLLAVAIEVVCALDPERRLLYRHTWRMGILSPVWSWELWRPFTTNLLHGGPFHVAFNAYWMVVFGRVLEPRFGSFRYLAFLLVLGTISSMLPFLINNLDTPLGGQIGSVGLSGIGYGLFGLLWVGRRWRPEFRDACSGEMVMLFIGWFFLCIVLTYTGHMNISNSGHATGWAFGALYGMALYTPRGRLGWRLLAIACSLAVLATTIACPGHPLYERHRQNELLRQQIQQLQLGKG